MTDILKAVEDSRAVGQTGWTRDDVRYAISFTIRDRDAEWRAAVERVRCEPVNRTAVHLAIVRAHNAALDALLAAMEAK